MNNQKPTKAPQVGQSALTDGLGMITLTKDVDCPWCIARSGEDCWDTDAAGKPVKRKDLIHAGRGIRVPNN